MLGEGINASDSCGSAFWVEQPAVKKMIEKKKRIRIGYFKGMDIYRFHEF
jgi:hypothetical protein